MWRADQTTRPRKKYETPVPSAIFKCIFKQIEFRMFQWLGRPRKTFPEVVLNTCSYIYKSVYLNVVSYLRASLTQPKGKMGRQRQDWGEQSLKNWWMRRISRNYAHPSSEVHEQRSKFFPHYWRAPIVIVSNSIHPRDLYTYV